MREDVCLPDYSRWPPVHLGLFKPRMVSHGHLEMTRKCVPFFFILSDVFGPAYNDISVLFSGPPRVSIKLHRDPCKVKTMLYP